MKTCRFIVHTLAELEGKKQKQKQKTTSSFVFLPKTSWLKKNLFEPIFSFCKSGNLCPKK